MKRSGVADLPLHGGRVPPWLATRMTTLGTRPEQAIGSFRCSISVLADRLRERL
jgi:hypothetical protein